MKINGKEYITVADMAERLGIEPNTIKQRLYKSKVKPLSRDALYEISALDIVRNVKPVGKPKATNKPVRKRNSRLSSV